MANDELVFYVKLYVKPECIDAWKDAVHEIIEAMSEEEAFVSCFLHQDSQDQTQFTLYERWREPSVVAFLEHQTKPYRIAYDAKLEHLLQRPREPQVLKPLGQWLKK
jgi:quinol monooxygenase YgiN